MPKYTSKSYKSQNILRATCLLHLVCIKVRMQVQRNEFSCKRQNKNYSEIVIILFYLVMVPFDIMTGDCHKNVSAVADGVLSNGVGVFT